LLKNGKIVADGAEQVLLRNRKSWYGDLVGYSAAVINWLPAKIAIQETGNSIRDYSDSITEKLDYALIGYLYKDHKDDKVYKPVNMDHVEDLFSRVHDDGTVLFLRFDEHWADYLFEMGILAVIPDVWRGWQTGGWKGNGWGYLDHFVGDQAIPSGTTISTNSWEVSSDAMGFYPFRSQYPHAAYGTFFASPGDLVTTLGTIRYGKGTIIIDPSYWVDYNETFNDILFYKLISINVAELNE
jgi:beta-galactosidase